ncbi:MAG: hypothetical protein IT324_24295 [Anaerolineae bacterium]|nr:hypothetical protein [Anaerolineae bacterium]
MKPPLSGLKFIILGLALCFAAACDPLAPEPTRVVVVLTPMATDAPATPTSAATDTPVATPEALATEATLATDAAVTETPIPSTAIPTATQWVCNEKQGQIVDLQYKSKIARLDQRYRVYLPPCYAQTTRRYPYVILMHGSDANEKEWTELLAVHEALDSGIALQALPPMILVMPNGGNLANTNVFQEGVSWESLIISELMPEVERNFCTWNAREGRAIGGISRGGFWAFEIGFRHPDLFGAIGGHSPFFDANNAGPGYNPLSLAKSVQFAPGKQPRIWIDAGKDDYARPNIEVFQRTLSGRNIDPGYTMNPTGKHEVAYWAQHVSEYLSFYGQTWPRTIEDLPSCLQ